MALVLHLRRRFRTRNPSLLYRLFSTSDSGGGAKSNSPFSSYFRDVKDNLKQQHKQPSTPSATSSFSKQNYLEEIQRNLSEFRRRTSVPPPADPSSSQQISFQELYKRNVSQKQHESTGNADSEPAKPSPKSSDGIREILQHLKAAQGGGDGKGTDRMSLPAFKDALKSKPSDSASSKLIGGTSALPELIFGREMKENIERDGSSSAALRSEFVKIYTHSELGEKLRKLRPEGKGNVWFSLGELNERLMRLREMDEEEFLSTNKAFSFNDIRAVLHKLKEDDDAKAKKTSRQ